MLSRQLVFEIHRLKNEGYKARAIARKLKVGRNTIRRYLEHPEKGFAKEKQRTSKPDPFKPLIIDEIGYLPLGPHGSNLFFQVISSRHQNRSTLITTNLPFSEWGKIFDSTTAATAIADRLVYQSEILVLEGSSYRKREMKQ